jgi:peptidoglycan/LPS O-acetylase OafA/YrhL
MSMLGTAQKRLEKFPAFDGFRGIGVLIVVMSHFPDVVNSGLYSFAWKLNQLSRIGYVALDIFFVISGFFITRLLLRERATTGRISFTNFYSRRALRIFPIYYLSIVVCYFVFKFGATDTLSLLTYTFNFYHPFHPAPHPLEHTWSLSVEEQFYFFWPLLILLVPPRLLDLVTGRLIPVLAVASGLLMAWTIGAQDSLLSGDIVYMSLFTRMLSLSLGGWLAVREFENRPLRGLPCVLLAIGALVILALDRFGRDHGVIVTQGVYWTIALVAYAMFSVAFVATMVFDRGLFQRTTTAVLSWPILRWMGAISYALYLFHLPVLFVLGMNPGAPGIERTTLAQVAMALFITIALAIISYLAIERPLQSVKRRFGPATTGDGLAAQRVQAV